MKEKSRYLYISFLNKIIPKKKKKIFFFDRGLISFNEIEMIKWTLKTESQPKNKIILCTNRPDYAKKMFPEGVLILSSTIRGLFHQLTSSYVFVEQNGHRWLCKPALHQKIVQLWHGTPIKKVGSLNNRNQWYKYDDAYNYVLAPSEYSWEIMKKCYGYQDYKKIICPYPRCDAIAHGLTKEQLWKLVGETYGKIVLWLPTFRTAYYEESKQYVEDFPILNNETADTLNCYLQSNNIILIIKLHALQKKVSLFSDQFSNIRFMQNTDLIEEGVTLYNLIGESDCLISDYSSVIFDYLLHDKPIIFTNSDYDHYKEQRGFINEELFQNLPGRIAGTLSELVKALDEVLRDDPFKNERARLNAKMNKSGDFNYCREVFRLVGITNDK